MQSFEKPIISGVELPDPVLPWELSKRVLILGNTETGLLWQTLRKHGRESEQFAEARKYKDWLYSHYLLDGGATHATMAGIDMLTIPEIQEDGTSTQVYKKLETAIGLGESGASDYPGYRLFAGFESGKYPTAAVAGALGLTPNALLEFIDQKAGKYSWVAAKIGSIVAPIQMGRTEEMIAVSGAIELNEAGERVFDLTLRAYELGLSGGQTSN